MGVAAQRRGLMELLAPRFRVLPVNQAIGEFMALHLCGSCA